MSAPAEPVIARVNGAEFLVCMEGVARRAAGDCQIARISMSALRQPFQWRRERMAPSAAMGIAQADEGYAHPEELMRDADIGDDGSQGPGARAAGVLFEGHE